MTEPKVTAIMAVYNAEPYLRRCLDSIQAQTLKDFDVILVDDGSTDSSLAIAEEYAKQDCRFRVYHKENGGVSSARQFGIERLAEKGGKYSIHVDPDDWVEPQMLERLYRKAEETGADMVICDYYQELQNRQLLHRQDPKSEDPRQVLDALFQRLHGSLWNKLVRTACYEEAGIKFPEGLNYCEDFYVNVCLLLRGVRRVVYLPEAFYHYDNYTNTLAETKKVNSQHIDFTRTEIVRRLRGILPVGKRSWQFRRFEAGMAFGIIKKGSMKDREFKSFFREIPFSLLFRPGCFHTFIIVTLLGIHTPLGRKNTTAMLRAYRKLKKLKCVCKERERSSYENHHTIYYRFE